MKVQIIKNITKLENGNVNGMEITLSPLSAPFALDDFDVNIIDISDPLIWTYSKKDCGPIDAINDLKSIYKMVENKQTTIVTYVLPQNCEYRYGTGRSWDETTMNLKDMVRQLSTQTLATLIFPFGFVPPLVYEKTRTKIGEKMYNADFYFQVDNRIITQSERSNKVTTIALIDNIFATTLSLNDEQEYANFINNVIFKSEKEETPEWIKDILFWDDEIHKSAIDDAQIIIKEATERIHIAKEKLEENLKFKSILYTNGDELVEVVFHILERLLECDLSEFEDKKREDFLIKKPECTFIGEIKGVTSNIKYEHISQLEVHFRKYLDELDEAGESENVKQILIMNPFRSKPLSQRDPVHTEQIKLAERNECLIIETNTLLHAYEKYLKNELSSCKCIELFSNKTGLLHVSDLNDCKDN